PCAFPAGRAAIPRGARGCAEPSATETRRQEYLQVTSKCLLMKAEVTSSKSGRFNKPKDAFEDTDGLYDPECENSGMFKAKQCNGTSCWCVNTAVFQQVRVCCDVKAFLALVDTITSRYLLDGRYIGDVVYENPYITVDLKQNSSSKSAGDVDIADVAYYFEKDAKGDSIFHNDRLNISVDNEALKFDKMVVYYVDEIAPEFSMKSVTPGVIAVIVVVVLAVVAGIAVLVSSRKAVKEMNEMHRGLNA
uniref:Epithelial cell adhesion molecule n=1 Tax=Nothoprocta perdicaria TaxID=30464 RepID=A0A8C6YUY4_NOTPE